jgi:hypothetical protein
LPCFSQKFALAVALGAVGASGAAMIPAAPTVLAEAAAIAAFLGAAAGAVAAASALADCLEDVGRQQDAETLRREVDDLKRELCELEKIPTP